MRKATEFIVTAMDGWKLTRRLKSYWYYAYHSFLAVVLLCSVKQLLCCIVYDKDLLYITKTIVMTEQRLCDIVYQGNAALALFSLLVNYAAGTGK